MRVVGGVVMGDAGTMTEVDPAATDPAAIDLAAVRADTPGCRQHAFLDSAGSSLPPRPVVDTVVGHLRLEAEIGGDPAAGGKPAGPPRAHQEPAALLPLGGAENAPPRRSTPAPAQAGYPPGVRARGRLLPSP